LQPRELKSPFGGFQGDPVLTSGSGALILVVERDPHVRALEQYFLEEAGEFAEDGLQALELARRLVPVIVISEIPVPKRDGLSVCKALKGDPAGDRSPAGLRLAASSPQLELFAGDVQRIRKLVGWHGEQAHDFLSHSHGQRLPANQPTNHLRARGAEQSRQRVG
jgi:CheY-like chemotaxis protein